MGMEVTTAAGAPHLQHVGAQRQPRGRRRAPQHCSLCLAWADARLIHTLLLLCDLDAALGSGQLGVHLPLWMALWGSSQKTAKPFA